MTFQAKLTIGLADRLLWPGDLVDSGEIGEGVDRLLKLGALEPTVSADEPANSGRARKSQ